MKDNAFCYYYADSLRVCPSERDPICARCVDEASISYNRIAPFPVMPDVKTRKRRKKLTTS